MYAPVSAFFLLFPEKRTLRLLKMNGAFVLFYIILLTFVGMCDIVRMISGRELCLCFYPGKTGDRLEIKAYFYSLI